MADKKLLKKVKSGIKAGEIKFDLASYDDGQKLLKLVDILTEDVKKGNNDIIKSTSEFLKKLKENAQLKNSLFKILNSTDEGKKVAQDLGKALYSSNAIADTFKRIGNNSKAFEDISDKVEKATQATANLAKITFSVYLEENKALDDWRNMQHATTAELTGSYRDLIESAEELGADFKDIATIQTEIRKQGITSQVNKELNKLVMETSVGLNISPEKSAAFYAQQIQRLNRSEKELRPVMDQLVQAQANMAVTGEDLINIFSDFKEVTMLAFSSSSEQGESFVEGIMKIEDATKKLGISAQAALNDIKSMALPGEKEMIKLAKLSNLLNMSMDEVRDMMMHQPEKFYALQARRTQQIVSNIRDTATMGSYQINQIVEAHGLDTELAIKAIAANNQHIDIYKALMEDYKRINKEKKDKKNVHETWLAQMNDIEHAWNRMQNTIQNGYMKIVRAYGTPVAEKMIKFINFITMNWGKVLKFTEKLLAYGLSSFGNGVNPAAGAQLAIQLDIKDAYLDSANFSADTINKMYSDGRKNIDDTFKELQKIDPVFAKKQFKTMTETILNDMKTTLEKTTLKTSVNSISDSVADILVKFATTKRRSDEIKSHRYIENQYELQESMGMKGLEISRPKNNVNGFQLMSSYPSTSLTLPPPSTQTTVLSDSSGLSLKDKISLIESKGSGGYLAESKSSSATGKYQFIRDTAGDLNNRYTLGAPSDIFSYKTSNRSNNYRPYRDFMITHPDYQELLMDAAIKDYTLFAQRTKGAGHVTEMDIAMIHFLGGGGWIQWDRKGRDLNYRPTSNNATVGQYKKVGKFSDIVVAGKGFLANKPTSAIVGEKGPELILPVQLQENNKKTEYPKYISFFMEDNKSSTKENMIIDLIKKQSEIQNKILEKISNSLNKKNTSVVYIM